MERTFVAIKPDGVQRCLIGNIISRYENKGYKIVGMKMISPKKELIEEHYAEHKGKGFYPSLISFLTSGPVVALCIEGKNVVKQVRKINGATNPSEADLGTIRGDLGVETGRNVVHSSDSVETAKKELALWFSKEEILSWTKSGEKEWVYEN